MNIVERFFKAFGPLWALGLVVGLAALLLPGRSLAYSGCSSGEIAPVVNAAYEQEIVNRVNTIRSDAGLAPFQRVDALDQAARYHATDMGQDDYFDLDTYDRAGSGLVEVCGWLERIAAYYTANATGDDNGVDLIISRFPEAATPAQIVDDWMNDDAIRSLVLHPDRTEIGVGYYQANGASYWVQNTAEPVPAYRILIPAIGKNIIFGPPGSDPDPNNPVPEGLCQSDWGPPTPEGGTLAPGDNKYGLIYPNGDSDTYFLDVSVGTDVILSFENLTRRPNSQYDICGPSLLMTDPDGTVTRVGGFAVFCNSSNCTGRYQFQAGCWSNDSGSACYNLRLENR